MAWQFKDTSALWHRIMGDSSGAEVARVYRILLGCIFLVAWISLGTQVHQLIGSTGLLPVEVHMDNMEEMLQKQATCRAEYTGDSKLLKQTCGDFSVWDYPTLFWHKHDDTTLTMGIALGCILALAAICGLWPGLCFGLMTALYLSYTLVCRDFLAFQWDNMLLECGFLAMFLKSDRRQWWLHFLFRLVLFKVYFQSGIAKWMSWRMDWHDGTAMSFYYETAPLPTWLGWYAHNLPEWWHHFESRAALVLELAIPPFVFGNRTAKLVALAALTGFQLLNLMTANYGFFVYLALALHVFLLTDQDINKLKGWLRISVSPIALKKVTLPPVWHYTRLVALTLFTSLMVTASAAEHVQSFGLRQGHVYWQDTQVHEWGKGSLSKNMRYLYQNDDFNAWRQLYNPFRIIHSYHLFGHITTFRMEAEFQTFDGQDWTAHHMHHKPGAPDRAPNLVAPHQPRVDFRLWFYPLRLSPDWPPNVMMKQSRRRAPDYVVQILANMCHEPEAVQSLFSNTLPKAPQAVRIVFRDFRFTTKEEREDTNQWWKTTDKGDTGSIACNWLGTPIRKSSKSE